MRLAFGIVVGTLLGALIAGLIWLIAFGHISVNRTQDAAPSIDQLPPAPENDPAILEDLPAIVRAGRLAVPVAGVRPGQLVDTYSQARANGARRHDAIDILAPIGTVVVAAAPGRVEKLFYSDRGGITAYVRSPDRRRIYYYAHLDRYAPGIVEGKGLAIGDPIGLVGSTGNADPGAPHLHFAVMRMREGEGWWQGEAINPYPLLVGRQ